jgi:NADH dehydrogenase [ubiquinone] 1 alpha subcomplex assembly factor 7
VNELQRQLARRIRHLGPLSIADFMSEALSHPHHGYYTTRDPLGQNGDFITAPEVSQMFGELIGLWCADVWEKMGKPARVILAELGPGRGTLMADALRALCVAPAFRHAIELHLVEISPTLRQRQATLLAGAEPRWHESAADLPEGPLILVANEFVDALPIRQLVRAADGWRERRVGLGEDGQSLVFALDPAPGAAAAALVPPTLADAAPQSLVEVRPTALSLAALLAARLRAQGGAALFIDYGHASSACGDTLQALRRHRHHDVLADPGEADLTAHVDFGAFGAAAAQVGARVWGPVTQGAFLASLGIAQRAAALCRSATPTQADAIASGCRRLIAAGEMGTLFKVLALTDPNLPEPAGFREDDAA